MQNLPKVSVIIPSLDGFRDGNVDKLISDLKQQTFKDFDLRIIKGIRPNGRARNVGSKDAKGEILVFIDDDIRMGHNKVLENLIGSLEADEKMAMTGASVQLPEDARYFQREYEKIRSFTTPIKEAFDYNEKVSHACLAIKKSIFEEAGGERDDLITGTDIDLGIRIKSSGYKAAVVPNTWVYHLMPKDIRKLVKEAFGNGVGVAYAMKVIPGVFGLPQIKFTNYTIKTKGCAFVYKILTILVKLPIYILFFKPIHFLFHLFYLSGYIHGWIKFNSTKKEMGI
jgi:glycosyltransferase involved in cell wall biosynthesis